MTRSMTPVVSDGGLILDFILLRIYTYTQERRCPDGRASEGERIP